jgi:hypothetical protein
LLPVSAADRSWRPARIEHLAGYTREEIQRLREKRVIQWNSRRNLMTEPIKLEIFTDYV